MKKLCIFTLFAGLIMAFTSIQAKSFSKAEQHSIEKIVHEYIVNNPEVLVEATQELRKRDLAMQQSQALGAIKNNAKELFSNENSPVAGNAAAKVAIVEFFDYQCGHCKNMHATIEEILASNDNVKVVYKELPIFGDTSEFAASAALAAKAQNKYSALHAAIMNESKKLTEDRVLAIAKDLGLDIDILRNDMQSPKVQDELESNRRLANLMGIQATPAFVLAKHPYDSAEGSAKFVLGAKSKKDMLKLIDSLL